MADVKEWREFVGLIKDLLSLKNESEPQAKTPTVEIESEDRIKSLDLALQEQRRDYDVLHSLHEGLKVKILTFLAAAFGILGYLYSAGAAPKLSIKARLFFPSQAYGMIFYVVGILLMFCSIAGLIVAMLKNRAWHTAFDNEQEDKLMNNYEEYLSYMHKRYKKISKINADCYEKRRYLWNLSLYSLILGATILLLIKTFGG